MQAIWLRQTLSFRAVINAHIVFNPIVSPVPTVFDYARKVRRARDRRMNVTNDVRTESFRCRVERMHFRSHSESIRTIIMIQLREVIRMHINLSSHCVMRSLGFLFPFFLSMFCSILSGRREREREIMYAPNSPFHDIDFSSLICMRFVLGTEQSCVGFGSIQNKSGNKMQRQKKWTKMVRVGQFVYFRQTHSTQIANRKC